MNIQHFNDIAVPFKESNIDLREAADRLCIGPQAAIVEKLDILNIRYNCNIGITKQFTLKPGAYNEIKKAYSDYVLRWNMKPKGIDSLFSRIRDNSWMSRNIEKDFLSLSTEMAALRLNGNRWQDNSDQIIEKFRELEDIITTEIEQANKMYPNIKVEAFIIGTTRIIPSNYRRGSFHNTQSFSNLTDIDADDLVDYFLVLKLYITKPIMNLHILKSDENIAKYELPMEDIIIFSGMSIFNIISNNWTRERRTNEMIRSTINHHIACIYLTRYGLNLHPFISSNVDRNAYEIDPNVVTSHTCTGNMGEMLKISLINMQILAHITHLANWMTNYYTPQTNPLHNITRLREYGLDKELLNIAIESKSDFFNHIRAIANQPAQWAECKVIDNLSGAIRTFGKREGLAGLKSQILIDQRKQYINNIDMKDLPCTNCKHARSIKDKCHMYDYMLRMVFGKGKLTPEDEGILGLVYELAEQQTFLVRYRSDWLHPEFIEETIKSNYAYVKHIIRDSYILYEFNMILRHAVEVYEVNVGGTTNMYAELFEQFYSQRDSFRMRHLYQFVLKNKNNDKVLITRNFVSQYLSANSSARLIESISDTNIDGVISDTLDSVSTETRIIGDPSENITDDPDNLSDSERTLRWATSFGGGAHNL